ncbi:hypothetical protein BC834DRAFT_454647 [Gloeopeniophorella convolvens]|nr:hypothetical protein BC834DRAFT_454647 [Gloeopeniophorella convolvens]
MRGDLAKEGSVHICLSGASVLLLLPGFLRFSSFDRPGEQAREAEVGKISSGGGADSLVRRDQGTYCGPTSPPQATEARAWLLTRVVCDSVMKVLGWRKCGRVIRTARVTARRAFYRASLRSASAQGPRSHEAHACMAMQLRNGENAGRGRCSVPGPRPSRRRVSVLGRGFCAGAAWSRNQAITRPSGVRAHAGANGSPPASTASAIHCAASRVALGVTARGSSEPLDRSQWGRKFGYVSSWIP